jgi:hypothetical protein
MALVPFDVRLARYHAAKKKHAARLRRQRAKRKAKAELRAVLAMARAALGWKPGGPKGGKLSPKHVAALHAGRDRYHQARKAKLNR